jgi:phosphatidate cytidylyltransferase
MLGQRIVTAVILLAVLAAAMMAPSPWPFLALMALATGCAGWEWLRLTLPQPPSDRLAVTVGVLLALAALGLTAWWTMTPQTASSRWSYEFMVYGVVPFAALLWVFCASNAVVRGRADAPPASAALTLFAIPALLATWTVLAVLFVQRGPWFVLSLLALVWVADIAAYFAGRAFGRRKLAPRISPGKTVEGALAGIIAVALWIAISSLWPGSFGAALVQRWTWWGALPFAAVLAVVSIMGDLFESLLKRRAGRKDSSALLPGHGGVYDRIDAVLPVAPLALILSGVLF